MEHFTSFDWTQFTHLSLLKNFEQIYEYTGIDIMSNYFDKKKGHALYQNDKHSVLFLTIDKFKLLT